MPYKKILCISIHNMLIEEEKIIFLHMPKTGGTSIESCLKKEFKKNTVYKRHNTLSQIFFNLKDRDLNKYIIFTVLRNPFDRIVSTYNHSKTNKYIDHNMIFSEYIGYIIKYFSNDFEENEYNSNTYMRFNGKTVIDKRHIETLKYWIDIPNILNFNNLKIKLKSNCLILTNEKVTIYLLRFKYLNSDFNIFKKNINVHSKLPHINKNHIPKKYKAKVSDFNKINYNCKKFLEIYSSEFDILENEFC